MAAEAFSNAQHGARNRVTSAILRLMPRLITIALCLALAHTTALRPVAPRPSVRAAVAARTPSAPLLLADAATSGESAGSALSISAAWGVCGFLSVLASAVKRLLPIALQPFSRRDLSLIQWSIYAGSVIGFAYVEGYGAFQKKFSRLVVRRAMTLSRAGAAISHKVFAPFYSMGLFHATKKRKIVSWSVSLSVFLLVGLVKRLPYPWRSIVDAGVCSGLCWGGASIVIYYYRALRGTAPAIDPCLPN